MYLVLSALTSSPISLVAATKASAIFLQNMYASSQYINIIGISQKLMCTIQFQANGSSPHPSYFLKPHFQCYSASITTVTPLFTDPNVLRVTYPARILIGAFIKTLFHVDYKLLKPLILQFPSFFSVSSALLGLHTSFRDIIVPFLTAQFVQRRVPYCAEENGCWPQEQNSVGDTLLNDFLIK